MSSAHVLYGCRLPYNVGSFVSVSDGVRDERRWVKHVNTLLSTCSLAEIIVLVGTAGADRMAPSSSARRSVVCS